MVESEFQRQTGPRQRSRARLEARIDGVFTVLEADESHRGYDLNTPTKISLRVRGSTIEARVGETVILSATHSQLSSGAVGLYTWGSKGVIFDDLSVVAE